MTDVTIRGIDDDVYALFAAEAKRRGVPIGELTTLVMRALVEEADKPTHRIGDLKHVPVTKADLLSVGGKVAFHQIGTLEFAQDVDWETFDAHVDSIHHAAKVLFHGGLSKFQILTKCREVGQVVPRK